MLHKLALLLAFTSIYLNTIAQHKHCGSTHQQQLLNSKLSTSELSQLELLRQAINDKVNDPNYEQKQNRAATYTIPVVVHILHTYTQGNISDAQVFDAIRILNEDYQKMNADTSSVVSAFINAIGNASIEFKLARKDPQGNCTNGIDRIYTAKAGFASDEAKINQWDRNKYLNIWVANDISNGAAGYAYLATSFQSSNANGYIDGIVIHNNYFGSIGTGSPSLSRALTHEVGHFLDLLHPWGGSNNPGVACGDDGVNDTPKTQGFTSCTLNNAQICTAGVTENVQNFMDYSYCSRMFTKGQCTKMKTIITSNIGGRGNLNSAANRQFTGMDLPPSKCGPKADFYTNKMFTCLGSSNNIVFTDASFGDDNITYTWQVPNGNITTSTSKNITTYFNTPGWQSITHGASTANGSSSITKSTRLYISDPNVKYGIGYWQGFEASQKPDEWPLFNVYDNQLKWTLVPHGRMGGVCAKLNTRDTRTDPNLKEVDTYDGDIDEIISPAFDLTGAAAPKLGFFTSGGREAFSQFSPTDELIIYYSKNCGTSWTQMAKITENGSNNLLNKSAQLTTFVPTTTSDWAARQFAIPATAISNTTYFKIRYKASNAGNDFFLDDITVSNWATDIADNTKTEAILALYPNPSNGNVTINTNVVGDVKITDISGKLVAQYTTSQVAAAQGTIACDGRLSQGLYFVTLAKQGQVLATQKLVVQ
jgi:hypothetical protein